MYREPLIVILHEIIIISRLVNKSKELQTYELCKCYINLWLNTPKYTVFCHVLSLVILNIVEAQISGFVCQIGSLIAESG